MLLLKRDIKSQQNEWMIENELWMPSALLLPQVSREIVSLWKNFEFEVLLKCFRTSLFFSSNTIKFFEWWILRFYKGTKSLKITHSVNFKTHEMHHLFQNRQIISSNEKIRNTFPTFKSQTNMLLEKGDRKLFNFRKYKF